jgi:hypothetical protein
MLARTQEALRQPGSRQVAQIGIALDAALHRLLDYAGLFPPANLSLREAVNNYQQYASGSHAAALASFVLSFSHLDALRLLPLAPAPFPLSIAGALDAPWNQLKQLQREGLRIQMIEVKISSAEQIRALQKTLPASIVRYFEVPLDASTSELLDAISCAGGRVKLRLGGVTDVAFPPPRLVAETLHTVAQHRLKFKATAGLHHPLRSIQPLSYEPSSARTRMHGFINLLSAAALLHLGGSTQQAEEVLLEEDPAAWTVVPEFIQWRDHRWNTAQLQELRRSFLMSIGSCSFREPINDLEALGWL